MERIRELLAKLTELTADELTELRGLIVDEFDRVEQEATTPENVAVLNELADAGETVQAEAASREAAQAQAEADAQSARERMNAISGEGESGEEEDPAAGSEEEEDPTAEGEGDEGEGAPAGEEAAVAASAGAPTPEGAGSGTVRRMAARGRGAATPSPEAGEAQPNRATLTATGALRGIDASRPIEDRYQFAEALADTLRRMHKDGPARGDVLVASATWEYPEDRRLEGSDLDTRANIAKLEAAISPQALAASGGICLPVNVDYSVPTWATADRPLRDGLPAFQATRGGIRYVTPPDIGAWSAATAVWSQATDAAPGASTKPVVVLNCGAEQLVYVDAVSTRLGFGNMQSRFAPEQIAANTDVAMAMAARVAENNLLAKIAAQATAAVTSAVTLGATRDLITVIEQVVAGYKYLHRLPDSTILTAIFPVWLKYLLKVDLAREIAHDNASDFNVLAITDQQVDDILKAHKVNPIWHLDGQAANGSVYPLQGFPTQGASSAVNPFPAKVAWYIFAEGAIQFLDGGRLDLGVVRDSTLDATNDYETFVETFEAIANRGFGNAIYQMVSTLCANGGTAATISTAGQCA